MRVVTTFLSVAILAASVASPALAAECKLGKLGELPVTMIGQRPIVTAEINKREARLILDSGAFYSTLSAANALEYGLKMAGSIPGVRLTGIGGDTSLRVAKAKEFRIAGFSLNDAEFVVGGSDTGFAGLLGQNILGFADVEYDLPHGMVRLVRSQSCKEMSLAYWAGDRPVTLVELEPTDKVRRHTVGTVLVNGKKLKAAFDTGAMTSMITQAAAKRIGVTPNAPDATAGGFVYGVGKSRAAAWRARFESMNIGGEAIRRPWLTVADVDLGGPDLLIGVDFFLTHRVLVDNQHRRMFVTYEGGPVFGLDPKTAVDQTGAKLDLEDKTGEPTDAAGFSRRGAVLAANQKLDEALADLDRAIAMAPDEPQYLFQRAALRIRKGQLLLVNADLDRAIVLRPSFAEARMARAQLRLGARDPEGALNDLRAADAALAPSADLRLSLAALFNTADAPEEALKSYDQWLGSHREDSDGAGALNGRCWARALLARDLDKALADCDAAVRLRPGNAAYLDSRALVRLRRGEFDKALADYDAALKVQPRNAWSLFARSIAAKGKGDMARSVSDRQAALALDPNVAARAKRYGLAE